MKKIILCFFSFLIIVSLFGQNTVGLLSYNPTKAFPGYNLLFPAAQPNVYLLNNCGEIVHSWEDEFGFLPGNSVYLMENGNLIKAKRRNSPPTAHPIWAGGGGEIVEIRNWENDLLASFELNDSIHRLHHDIAPLPNGNILLLAWENKTGEEAFQAGRDTSLLSQGKVWSEAIFEWNPATDEIVWEWHAWDHLVQDFNTAAENLGVIANHPELINIGYDEHGGHPDWLHINAIDYNPVLDQIVLSVPYFNEFWIIDHSTTTIEAASSEGGNSGKGGDLLYRWGNSMTYNQGEITDKKLFFQHDVHWIDPLAKEGSTNFGQIALFNNRVGENLSSGNIITTSYNPSSIGYELSEGKFTPTDFTLTSTHPKADEEIRASSASLSSVQYLPNNNVLLCAGRWGYSYEINPENQVVWEYITPIKAGKPAFQGDSLILNNNLTFRTKRYSNDFSAFVGRDLSSKGPIELNPTEDFCGALSVSTKEVIVSNKITVFPNPASKYLTIEKVDLAPINIIIFDILGRKQLATTLTNTTTSIDVNNWEKGIYFLSTNGGLVQKIFIY